MSDALLVIDVGTSGVRAAIVSADASVSEVRHRQVLPITPAPGLVELDAPALAAAAVELATEVLHAAGPVAGVGIANQRASAIVWERASGLPVGPGIGWQDLRTVGPAWCSRPKATARPERVGHQAGGHLGRGRPRPDEAADELCFGTVDTWLCWVLGGGAQGHVHVTDATNAAVTGLVTADATGWDPAVLQALRIPESMLPAIVDSSGAVAPATALPAHRSSAAWPVTSRPRWSARPACAPGRRRRPSGPAACSTCAPGRCGPPSRCGGLRDLSDRGVAPWWRRHLGRRGDHALGRDSGRVAP